MTIGIRMIAIISIISTAYRMPSTAFITATFVTNSFIKGTNRIFDLKTRATNAIRLNVEQCERQRALFAPIPARG